MNKRQQSFSQQSLRTMEKMKEIAPVLDKVQLN